MRAIARDSWRAGWQSILGGGLIAVTFVACAAQVGGDGSGPGNSGGNPSTPGGMMTPPASTGSQPADVGTVALRQLTVAEYNNTVRDLLGTNLRPADTFETSEADGFDTIATAGIINNRKVADYFDAAGALADDVFGKPALRDRIVTCQPAAAGDTACARTIITTFGKRAFRRPLDAGETAQFLDQYGKVLAQMVDHAGAIKEVVRTMLAAPQFLYRIEFDPDATAAKPHALGVYEMASRLSFTIWSSTPDDQLLASADQGKLGTVGGLQTEVDRLLADPRSTALADNFAGQWLGSRRLTQHTADPMQYPQWNDALRQSMQQEMGMYFDAFLHGDQTYDKFLTTDMNFVDANLAALYGVPAPAGAGLTKVTGTGNHRVGFLGLAGFLTHTSRPERSAPAIRGQWVLDALGCVHLELPPNFTPPPLAEPMAGQSVRQQVEQHGSMPACSPCHSLLDPVGLGLEHFDGIGRYRETYPGGVAIDTTGVLPGARHFDGLEGLAGVLAADPSFVTCAARKLFTYGIGRAIDPGDASAPYLDQIVERWKGSSLGFRNLLKQLVASDTFRFRRPNN